MKKLLLSFLILNTLVVNAQCEDGFIPSGFVDFSDTNGDLHTFNDYLFNGKIIVVDFYIHTCGLCMASSPCMETIYQNYGWNNGDVIVLAFDITSGNPTDEEAAQWASDYGMPNVPNFGQKGGEQNTIGFWGQFYSSCGENGGLAQSYILTGDFCCGDPSAMNYETGCSAYCGDNSCCIYNTEDLPPIEGISYVHQGGVVNCNEMMNHIDNLINQMADINDYEHSINKEIINTINILGQSTINRNNTILFDVFNDGTVEKKYLVK